MAITPLSRKKEVTYADFGKDLLQNPVNMDVARKTDVFAIKESIKNLLLTSKGERLFQPYVGAGLRDLLFEHITPDIEHQVKYRIEETLNTYEPRCNLISVDVFATADYDPTKRRSNSIEIVVTFSVININEPLTLSITLDRVR